MDKQYSSSTYSWLSSQVSELGQTLLAENSVAPESAEVDGKELKMKSFSPSLISSCKKSFVANWSEPFAQQLSVEKPDTLKLNKKFELPVAESVLEWLEKLPFEVCIGGKIFADWPIGNKVVVFPGQYPLGWMIALKGEGHNYLVSPTWVDFAPVKVYKKSDVTLIQFHDLLADSSAALEQAQLSWKFFNSSPESGFINKRARGDHKFNGQYNSEDGGLYITVVGQDPTYEELKDACYAKNYSELIDGRPIKKVVYVFLEHERAKKWLHELWIRGIECRAFIDGKEIVLSDDYHPAAEKNVAW